MAENLKDRKPELKVVPPADPKHNQTQQQKDDARANLLRRHLHQLRSDNAACDVSAAAHKENTDARTDTYRLIKAELGLTRAQVDDYMRKLEANTRELVEQEKIRQKDYKTLELPTFEQLDMFAADKPKEKQDGAFWRIEGYKAGLAFKPAEAPTGCSGDNLQEFLNGHKDGAAALQASIDGAKPVETAPAATVEEAV